MREIIPECGIGEGKRRVLGVEMEGGSLAPGVTTLGKEEGEMSVG